MKFYVYAHRTLSPRGKGEIFYIGKGCGYRAWARGGHNIYWTRIVEKHGYSVQILAKNLTEEQAFQLEKAFISISGREILCNLTDGGEGMSGHKPTESQLSKLRTPVSCSNGMNFKSILDATRWVRALGYSAPTGSLITKVCQRKKSTAYGFSWKYTNSPETPNRPKQEQMKKVFCSNGNVYHSLAHAVVWLRNNGFPKAAKINVSNVCRGSRRSAYGLTWSYDSSL